MLDLHNDPEEKKVKHGEKEQIDELEQFHQNLLNDQTRILNKTKWALLTSVHVLDRSEYDNHYHNPPKYIFT